MTLFLTSLVSLMTQHEFLHYETPFIIYIAMIKLKVLICEIYLAVLKPWEVFPKWELIDC